MIFKYFPLILIKHKKEGHMWNGVIVSNDPNLGSTLYITILQLPVALCRPEFWYIFSF
jgi:hypothetical protein